MTTKVKEQRPLHPGEQLKSILETVGVSITVAAAKLQISRVTLSRFINGAFNCSNEMALKLEAATSISAETWLEYQINFDLFHARKKFALAIEPFLTY